MDSGGGRSHLEALLPLPLSLFGALTALVAAFAPPVFVMAKAFREAACECGWTSFSQQLHLMPRPFQNVARSACYSVCHTRQSRHACPALPGGRSHCTCCRPGCAGSLAWRSGQQCPELSHLLETTPCAAPHDALPARPEYASWRECSRDNTHGSGDPSCLTRQQREGTGVQQHLAGASSSGCAPPEPSPELCLSESWPWDASLSASELPSAAWLPLAASAPEL